MAITNVRLSPAILKRLHYVSPKERKVLSVYLNTSPKGVIGEAFLLSFRDGCKAIRATLDAKELDGFEAAVMQAERYLTDTFVPSHHGLALFASGEVGYFYAIPLPKAPAQKITWGEKPELSPLEEVIDEYERVAVALFDKERARLFTIYLGAIEQQKVIEDEVPRKQATGEWVALAQARYQRHHEDHVLRHAKRTIGELMAELRTYPFDRLILGGPSEAVSLLEHHLPRPLLDRLSGTISVELFASDSAVLEAALEVMEAIERRVELKAVQELLEAAATRAAALGFESTLEALNQGRVHRLFVASQFTATGGECESCGRLVVDADGCSSCGGRTRAAPDFGERLVEQAMDQGGKIEFVSGEAAMLLLTFDGLGAWTRY